MACTRVFLNLKTLVSPWEVDGVLLMVFNLYGLEETQGIEGLQRILRLHATQGLQEQALFPKRLRGNALSRVPLDACR